MERKMIKWVFIGLIFMNGCYYDNEEELYPSAGPCVTQNMSFKTDILPIIKNNCTGCHNSIALQGGIAMENYEQITPYIENGSFLGSIKHESGFSPMPKNTAKMSNCQISKIQQWILDGAQDN